MTEIQAQRVSSDALDRLRKGMPETTGNAGNIDGYKPDKPRPLKKGEVYLTHEMTMSNVVGEYADRLAEAVPVLMDHKLLNDNIGTRFFVHCKDAPDVPGFYQIDRENREVVLRTERDGGWKRSLAWDERLHVTNTVPIAISKGQPLVVYADQARGRVVLRAPLGTAEGARMALRA